jgi:Putative serine esterase (DUF676)
MTRWKRVSVVVAVLASAGAVVVQPGAVSAEVTTYSATETIPVPPASTYQGAGGGDGWAVALTDDSVYNVFHHAATLRVACHRQSDASECYSPKTITDTAGASFSTSNHPGLWLDPATDKLYVYATRNTTATAGVVCIDTTLEADANPFCGFVELSAAGEAVGNQLGSPALAGGRWYAFNYVRSNPVVGTKNHLLCFDVATQTACAGQPYQVVTGTVTTSSISPIPATVAGQILVPVSVDGAALLACFSPASGGTCAGSWPAPITASYISINGAPFPMLSSTGNPTGVCLPASGAPCWDLAGTPVATPPGLAFAVPASSPYSGQAFVLGPRVYVPNGNTNQVHCYNYATGDSCTHFPKSFANLGYLYTVNADPARPTCIWVNADNGSGQIQNFDAYSGGSCGDGPIRVLASSIVVNSPECVPTSYTSLAVLDPDRSQYGSGTVAFADGDANQIPGAGELPLDASGTVSLAGLQLNTAAGLPQFLITLNDPVGTPGSVTVRLTWTGERLPGCVPDGPQITEPVIVLVHGLDAAGQSGVDCDDYWGDLRNYLNANGFADRQIVTVGYYDGDRNCVDISSSWDPELGNSYFTGVGAHGAGVNGHSAEAAIEHLGYHLAWWIYNNYSSRGIPVDVVGHSMGGLMIRFAVGKVDGGHDAFPPTLIVHDAITLGTPHGGSRQKIFNTVCGQRQCSQMRPGDGFLKSLEAEAWNPQGTGGTDWTSFGSDNDQWVAADRAVGTSENRKTDAFFGGCHKVWYPNLRHDDYMKVGAYGPVRNGNGLFVVFTSGDKCGAPLEQRRVELLSPVAQIAAALESSAS